jgi:HPt (histidine-containing phosphotransfer) domain-containing protein
VRSTLDVTLDLEQFRDLALGDRQLMREIVWALIDDTSRHAALLESAIRSEERERIVRIARSAARACSNVGANAAAGALRAIEQHAHDAAFDECRSALAKLCSEIERLCAVPWER